MSHADQIFGTASSIKAFVLFALLRKADEEGVNLATKKIDGTPIIALATSMIQVSSNSAANTLIDYVGMDKVNEEIHRDARPVSHPAR